MLIFWFNCSVSNHNGAKTFKLHIFLEGPKNNNSPSFILRLEKLGDFSIYSEYMNFMKLCFQIDKKWRYWITISRNHKDNEHIVEIWNIGQMSNHLCIEMNFPNFSAPVFFYARACLSRKSLRFIKIQNCALQS